MTRRGALASSLKLAVFKRSPLDLRLSAFSYVEPLLAPASSPVSPLQLQYEACEFSRSVHVPTEKRVSLEPTDYSPPSALQSLAPLLQATTMLTLQPLDKGPTLFTPTNYTCVPGCAFPIHRRLARVAADNSPHQSSSRIHPTSMLLNTMC